MNPALLEQTFPGLDVDFLGPKQSGKVRDIYARDDRLILITTDRLSAFDHILGLVPFKGQVLNQLSSFWFEQTQDIVANHFIESPDPNVTIVRKCRTLPVEVVVRGFISGVTKTSLWYQYSQGERTIYGMDFPDGLNKNDQLPLPVITPTTKAAKGGHDELITSKEIVEKGLVEDDLWEEVCSAALALFARGQEVAARGGLLLVDTKYEFGLSDDGRLLLIDEIHTPDSSRFWTMSSYEEVRACSERNGGQELRVEEPENFDKEFVRLAYAERGYIGDGHPPPLEEELAAQASQRYVECYERLTAQSFAAGRFPVAERVTGNLRTYFGQQ
ncbi:MAG: phosphoribosylaminoimidazolesuccinocarboxamide synthase [Caldilineaceae bacterium]|nr:phosphoribosylaminoimidazolesuccinocarboxamide synthase [Caldilineaceae bacterium]